MKLETIAVHAADPDPATGGVAPPIQLSTTFARDGNLELVPGGAQYAREGGPTTSQLEDALTRLEAIDPRAAQVVSLKFFSGMSTPEVAEYLQVSVRTVEADWTHARAWLKRELSKEA